LYNPEATKYVSPRVQATDEKLCQALFQSDPLLLPAASALI
jgi:hypothetical protein